MPQDAYTLRRVAEELENLLVGGKISKINMPERDELTLIIYTRCGSVKLEISCSAKNNRISLSETEKPNPQVVPNFCMLLRKHLQNAQITAVGQVGSERIIKIDFDCISDFSDSKMSLYCEIMGKYSNIILVEKGIISGAVKQTTLEENAKRILFSGAKYTLPAPQDKADPSSLDEISKAFENKTGEAAKFISSAVGGIAYSTALEMTETYGEDITAEQVYEYFNGDGYAPCIVFDVNGEPKDFKVRSCDGGAKRYADLLSAQKDYYAAVYKKQTFEDTKRKLFSALHSAVKKTEKRLGQIESKLLECDSAESVKLKGELITANIYRLERGMTSFNAVNYYDENLQEINILLDRQLTPAQNAQKYYRQYAKLKRTLAILSDQREETRQKYDYLNSINSSICAAECIEDLKEINDELAAEGLIKVVTDKKKKATPALPFRQYSFMGFTIFAGRNNVQNDRLIKSLSSEDLWLHARRFHSSHVGIISDGKTIPDEVILKAAEICAYYSEARDNDKVTIDFTKRKNVKKPPRSHPGFTTYSEYNSINVAPCAHRELSNEEK